MAEPHNMKARPLVKDEIVLLLDLITQPEHKALTSKTTNATNNRLKEEAWRAISEKFCALTGIMRRPGQLRLKWENLKKAARKRSALIRQKNLKTGGGKLFIPPDEVLERVASILGATCSGFNVEFGGDAAEVAAVAEQVEYQLELPQVVQSDGDGDVVLDDDVVLGGDVVLSGGAISSASAPKRQRQFVFGSQKNAPNKRRKLTENALRASAEKDDALRDYFKNKATKVHLENKKLELEIEILTLQKAKLLLIN